MRPTLGLRTRPDGLDTGRDAVFVPPLEEVVALVADDVARAEKRLGAALESVVPEVTATATWLQAAGGKRFRPLLTALGARAAGHPGDVSLLMCAGELVHLGSLLHDDVVDEGPERRGRPAAWTRFGNPMAVLAGDFCLARAVTIAATEGGYRAVEALGRTASAMAEGEVLQLLQRGDLAADEGAWREVVERKTAGLIAWCAAVGAWAAEDRAGVAGAGAHAGALARFGRAVGTAFQVTDDVLDCVGDPAVTGKRPGRDLVERKATLPLILAMRRVPALRERLEAGAPGEDEVPDLLAEVRACGATEEALAFARGLVGEALDALASLPASRWRDALEALGHHLVDRAS